MQRSADSQPTLQSGTQRLVGAASGVFCFERELGRRLLVALNFRSDRVPPALTDDARGPAFLELSTHTGREHGAVDLRDLVLEPDEGLILRLSRGKRAGANRTCDAGRIGSMQPGMRTRTHERIG
jgi:hypothetical protein